MKWIRDGKRRIRNSEGRIRGKQEWIHSEQERIRGEQERIRSEQERIRSEQERIRSEQGSITLEATLILPFFLVFFIALSCLIQIGVAEVALSSAVSETTKQIATHMYPAELLYREYESTSFGQTLNQKIAQMKQLQGQIARTEQQWTDDYAEWLPGPLLDVLESMHQYRLSVRQGAVEQLNEGVGLAFRPIVLHYADRMNGRTILDPDHLKIKRVTFPNFDDKDQAYFGLEAQYAVDLSLPFIHKVVYLTTQSYERVWVGK